MSEDIVRGEDAAEVMDFLERITSGDLPQCLAVARQEHAETGAALWLGVRDGLRRKIVQGEYWRENRSISPADDDALPF